ncbi:MAG: hypothetical protein E7425_04755 [Ruminococcaceae bacterium]|nr:hypothetical protein [Oscillospiraceae bacterium]
MSLRERIRAETDKLRPMRFSQKAAYLFRYYKGWLVGLLLLAALCGYIGDAVAQSRREIVLQGFFTNDDYNFFPAETLQREYAAAQGIGGRQRVVFDDSLYIDLNGEAVDYTAASRGKLVAYIATAELDFVVTTEPVLSQYRDELPMLDWKTLLPEKLFRALEPQLLSAPGEDGATVYYALSMRDSRWCAGQDGGEAYYLFAPYNAPHPEQLAAFVAYSFPG